VFFFLPSNAFIEINSAQLSYFTASAASGLQASVVSQMAAAAGAGWNAKNLAGVASTYPTDGCAGFEAAHVATMTPDAFAGWTKNCVSLLESTAWSQTNANQINQLSLLVLEGLLLTWCRIWLLLLVRAGTPIILLASGQTGVLGLKLHM